MGKLDDYVDLVSKLKDNFNNNEHLKPRFHKKH